MKNISYKSCVKNFLFILFTLFVVFALLVGGVLINTRPLTVLGSAGSEIRHFFSSGRQADCSLMINNNSPCLSHRLQKAKESSFGDTWRNRASLTASPVVWCFLWSPSVLLLLYLILFTKYTTKANTDKQTRIGLWQNLTIFAEMMNTNPSLTGSEN